jgi:hypothetical protein
MANAVSKLEPFRQFIGAERKRGTTYRRIAELLAEKGIEVDHSTIHSFVRVRSKPRRAVITMLDSDIEITSAAAVSTPQAPTGTPRIPERAEAQRDAIRRLKNAKTPARRPEKGLESFRSDAPLERVSPEEAKRQLDDPER